MIKGTIFDWDNCLFDTQTVGKDLVKPVVAVAVDEFDETTLGKIWDDLYCLSLEGVIAKYHIPKDLAIKMRFVYSQFIAPIWSKNYDDIILLDQIVCPKILVTTGFTNYQLSKIRVTKAEGMFDEIIIDSIDDPLKIKGKLVIFEEVMKERGWLPGETIVIGDSASSELKAGKELGAITIQTLRPGIAKVEGFDFYIKGLDELFIYFPELRR